jgi:hypothetical protein
MTNPKILVIKVSAAIQMLTPHGIITKNKMVTTQDGMYSTNVILV